MRDATIDFSGDLARISPRSRFFEVQAIATIVLACVGWLCTSCAQFGGQAGTDEGLEITSGATTPDGKLIFFHCRKHDVPMTGDFGMMVFYDVRQTNSLPRYELYVRKDHQIIRTTNLTAFKRRLSTIPAGETLHFYNTCAGGTHYGMDRAIIKDILRFCARRRIRVQEGDDMVYVICTCE